MAHEELVHVPFAEPRGIAARACTKCGVKKPLSDMEKDARSGTGRGPRCRPCSAAISRGYYARNSGEVRAAKAKYYQDNRESRRAYWRDNPAITRARDARRRARKLAATVEHFTMDDLLSYWDEIGVYACVYCEAPWEHIDHIMPLALGGEHSVYNLQPTCAACNLRKGAKHPLDFLREVLGEATVRRLLCHDPANCPNQAA